MSIIKKIIFLSVFITIISAANSFAEDLKKVGKFKDWEVMVMSESSGKVCFAQSTPVLQTPKKNKSMQIRSKWDDFIREEEPKKAGIDVCKYDDDNFLIIRRSNIDERAGQWTLPGGHIDDKDRSIEMGAIRELEEETGLTCSRANLIFLEESKPDKFYFWAKRTTGWFTRGWSNRCSFSKYFRS